MKNHFNIKNIAIITFMFICFFTFQNNVSAKKVVCNYRWKNSTGSNDGILDLILAYDDEETMITALPTMKNTISDTYSAYSAFNVGELKSLNDKCPSELFERTFPHNGDTGHLEKKYYLTKSASNNSTGEEGLEFIFVDSVDRGEIDIGGNSSGKNNGSNGNSNGNNSGNNSGNNDDTTDTKKCTLFIFNSVDYDEKVLQLFKVEGQTPIARIDGKESSDSEKISVDFTNSQIDPCPGHVYMTISHDNSAGVTTKALTLTEPSGKHADFVSVRWGKKTASFGSGDGCERIKGIGKYIKAGFSILRYAFPTLIIILSIIDFVGVVLSGEDDKMEKAKKHFITRILIGILIIFLPYFIEMLLHIVGIQGDLADLACSFISK